MRDVQGRFHFHQPKHFPPFYIMFHPIPKLSQEVIMPEYQLQVKQLVSYPRYRIYREFLQTLIADQGIRTSGCPGLFV